MNRQASQSSFENIMRMKRSARDEQVRAVYDADQSSLDLAAVQIKSVIRGVGSAAPVVSESHAFYLVDAGFDIGY
ncbi:hypothetical protein [Pseudomonas sp.]|uniref:hypothetical protein n=1 Tax=Pseudomonas sp. TaxID=306 RepID=UPI003D6EAEE5